MATGFLQRWNGKVLAKQFWLGGTKITATAAELNTAVGVGSVVAASTTTALLSSTAQITTISGTSLTYTLPAPVAGVRRVYDCVAALSTTLARKLYTGAGTILFDSTNTVLALSSAVGTVELIGVSTVKWGVIAANGGTYGTST